MKIPINFIMGIICLSILIVYSDLVAKLLSVVLLGYLVWWSITE